MNPKRMSGLKVPNHGIVRAQRFLAEYDTYWHEDPFRLDHVSERSWHGPGEELTSHYNRSNSSGTLPGHGCPNRELTSGSFPQPSTPPGTMPRIMSGKMPGPMPGIPTGLRNDSADGPRRESEWLQCSNTEKSNRNHFAAKWSRPIGTAMPPREFRFWGPRAALDGRPHRRPPNAPPR